MYYVYLIKSINYSDQVYVGYTENLEKRMFCHNSDSSVHTKQYKPWQLVLPIQFFDKTKALMFEKYLKKSRWIFSNIQEVKIKEKKSGKKNKKHGRKK